MEDGSTDTSNHIVKEYATRYSFKTKAIYQENKGLSAARNVGLAVANGEWIAYIDSDDFIEPEAFCRIIASLYETKADIVAFDGFRYVQRTSALLNLNSSFHPFNNRDCTDGLSYLEGMLASKMTNVVTVWDKVYRKSILDKHECNFFHGLIHEDIPHTFKLLCSGTTVQYVNEKAIFYRQREGSITSTLSERSLRSQMSIAEYLLHLFKSKGVNNKHLNDYLVFMTKNLVNQSFAVPQEFIYELFQQRLSAKKTAVLIWLRMKNKLNKITLHQAPKTPYFKK